MLNNEESACFDSFFLPITKRGIEYSSMFPASYFAYNETFTNYDFAIGSEINLMCTYLK